MKRDFSLIKENSNQISIESCYYDQVTKLTEEKSRKNNIKKKYLLPGFGAKPVNCVGIIPRHVCKNPHCANIEIVYGNCNGPLCPDCYQDWKQKRVVKGVKRILSYKLYKKVRCGHFVISVPPEETSKIKNEADIEDLRIKCRSILKDHQVYGAVEIFHPYRIKKQHKSKVYKVARDNYPDLQKNIGVWYALTKLVIDKKNKWEDLVEFEPHFHYIGVFKYSNQAVKRNDGFIFKKVGKDRYQAEDIFKTYMYHLSHLGISTSNNTHNIRWIGSLGNGVWSFDKVSDKLKGFIINQIERIHDNFKIASGYGMCKNCGSSMHHILNVMFYLNNYSTEHQIRIKYAYKWAINGVPPPIDKKNLIIKNGVKNEN